MVGFKGQGKGQKTVVKTQFKTAVRNIVKTPVGAAWDGQNQPKFTKTVTGKVMAPIKKVGVVHKHVPGVHNPIFSSQKVAAPSGYVPLQTITPTAGKVGMKTIGANVPGAARKIVKKIIVRRGPDGKIITPTGNVVKPMTKIRHNPATGSAVTGMKTIVKKVIKNPASIKPDVPKSGSALVGKKHSAEFMASLDLLYELCWKEKDNKVVNTQWEKVKAARVKHFSAPGTAPIVQTTKPSSSTQVARPNLMNATMKVVPKAGPQGPTKIPNNEAHDKIARAQKLLNRIVQILLEQPDHTCSIDLISKDEEIMPLKVAIKPMSYVNYLRMYPDFFAINPIKIGATQYNVTLINDGVPTAKPVRNDVSETAPAQAENGSQKFQPNQNINKHAVTKSIPKKPQFTRQQFVQAGATQGQTHMPNHNHQVKKTFTKPVQSFNKPVGAPQNYVKPNHQQNYNAGHTAGYQKPHQNQQWQHKKQHHNNQQQGYW